MQQHTLRTSDAFVVCFTHGDLYWHEGADESDVVDVTKLEPLRNDIERPKETDETRCPLCREHIRFEVRPKVRVIK